MAFYIKQYSKARNVYYPQAVVVGDPIETDEVAEELSAISTVSRSDVRAVLGDIAKVLAKLMKQGKSVRIEGLGTFRYTLDTTGVTNPDDFDFQKQVNAVRVQFIPEKTFGKRGDTATRALVDKNIEWIELNSVPPTGTVTEPDEEEEEGSAGSLG